MNTNRLIESRRLLIGVLLQPSVVESADDWTKKAAKKKPAKKKKK